MTPDPRPRIAAAFDRKAAEYDAFGENHPNLTRMRTKVYDHIARWHPAGGHLLELNAGTGLDASHLVQRGYTIHATDLAPAMVAAIKEKIVTQNLSDRLSAAQCDFHQLQDIARGPFAGVISNSGGLNCTSDLAPVISQLPALLRPGGVVTWVIMPRICPWELALLGKDFRVATRRLKRAGVIASVAGVRFRAYYHPAGQVIKAFQPHFRTLQLESISLLTPTADNKSFARRHPRLYQRLVRLDDWLATRRPFNGWGDFYALSLRYIGSK